MLDELHSRVHPVVDGPYLQSELMDCFYRDHSASIAQMGDEKYFVKYCRSSLDAQKSLLAHLLASPMMNVPRVMIPDAALKLQIDAVFKTRSPDARRDYVALVRLCQDYNVADLPIKDLTQAIASELVFSTWVNRRDCHNCNRVYVAGVPMFFDFDAAFVRNEAPTDFFRRGPDSGYVPNWRLWKVPKGDPIDTASIRSLERGRPLTLHPIHDVELFWTHFDFFFDLILGISASYIRIAVEAAMPDPAIQDAMIEFLLFEQSQLESKLASVQQVISSEIVDKPRC